MIILVVAFHADTQVNIPVGFTKVQEYDEGRNHHELFVGMEGEQLRLINGRKSNFQAKP